MLGFYIIHCKSSWTLKHRYNEDLVTDYSVNCSRLQFFTWLLIFRFNLRRQNTFSSKQTTTKCKIGEVGKKNRQQSTKLMESKSNIIMSLFRYGGLGSYSTEGTTTYAKLSSMKLVDYLNRSHHHYHPQWSVFWHRILFLQYWPHRVEQAIRVRFKNVGASLFKKLYNNFLNAGAGWDFGLLPE